MGADAAGVNVDLNNFGVGWIEGAIGNWVPSRIRVSAFIMVWKPEEKPISPVMPTSYGLSYSTCSLPRRAWTMGALILAANSTSSW